MPKLIIISTSGDLLKASLSLSRMRNNLPQMTRNGMMRWGKILERDMKTSASGAGISNFTGTLQSIGIDYRQGPRSDVGHLFVRMYGIYLDSMSPHFVSVQASRTRLIAWAKKSKSESIRRKAKLVEQRKMRSFSVFVRPHPFIAGGWRRARPKLGPIIIQEISKGVAAS
jgi:hypothetical protein